MSEQISIKDTLLLALINAGHNEAMDYAFEQVKGTVAAPVTQAVIGTVTGAPAAVADTGGEIDDTQLDKRGFPWCSQIHAKTKTQDAKGNWKYAVGIDRDNVVPAVEAHLVEMGYGQPVEAATLPPVAAAPVAAPAPGLPPVAAGLPPAPGLPPIAAPAPVKVEFPEVASEEDMTKEAVEQTAAALAGKHGNDALKKLLVLFGVTDGSANDIAPGYKYVFWQYATNDDGLRQQSVIS